VISIFGNVLFLVVCAVEMLREVHGMYKTELELEESLAKELPLLTERSHVVMYSAAFLNQPYIDTRIVAELAAIFAS